MILEFDDFREMQMLERIDFGFNIKRTSSYLGFY